MYLINTCFEEYVHNRDDSAWMVFLLTQFKYASIYQIKTEVTGILKENATEEGTKTNGDKSQNEGSIAFSEKRTNG